MNIPQVVGQLCVVLKISGLDRISQRTVEQISRCCSAANDTTMGDCAEMVSRDRIQQRTVEQTVDHPVSEVM